MTNPLFLLLSTIKGVVVFSRVHKKKNVFFSSLFMKNSLFSLCSAIHRIEQLLFSLTGAVFLVVISLKTTCLSYFSWSGIVYFSGEGKGVDILFIIEKGVFPLTVITVSCKLVAQLKIYLSR